MDLNNLENKIDMNLLIVGGSGFIGKSFIDGFNRGILKKSNLNKIYILSRKPWILKKCKGLDLRNIKLIKGDISNIKRLPNCNIIIYAAQTTNIENYKIYTYVERWKNRKKNWEKI